MTSTVPAQSIGTPACVNKTAELPCCLPTRAWRSGACLRALRCRGARPDQRARPARSRTCSSCCASCSCCAAWPAAWACATSAPRASGGRSPSARCAARTAAWTRVRVSPGRRHGRARHLLRAPVAADRRARAAPHAPPHGLGSGPTPARSPSALRRAHAAWTSSRLLGALVAGQFGAGASAGCARATDFYCSCWAITYHRQRPLPGYEPGLALGIAPYGIAYLLQLGGPASLDTLRLHAAEPAAPERLASMELSNFVRPLDAAHSPAWPFILWTADASSVRCMQCRPAAAA
jgi:hypothetical protein